MKRSILISSAAVLLVALSNGVAAAKPDFSGTWIMDRNRSIGLPPNMEQTMTVVHRVDKIELETKIVTAQGEQTIKDSYTLDGKETEFTPQGPGTPNNAKGKRTAKWLPRGNGIVISEETTFDGPNGQVTTQLTRKWILSPDGNTLTIDMYHDGPRGSFETKRIFVRKADSGSSV
ncbi:MAG TPA: hypothetical protein VD966_07330 [Pyrinomonadaceae bacterium]|nr:hypothetical protein [Pyrinomonadaceae bacterium]